MTHTNWGFPTTVWFGERRIADLPKAVSEIGAKKPLLVTDAGLRDLPIISKVEDILRGAGISSPIFSGIHANPTDEQVLKGTDTIREGKHDAVIIVGGGSAIDAGKAMAFMTAQTKPISAFEDVGDNWRHAHKEGLIPTIVVPTTAGTGSEFGRASVITDTQSYTKRKVIIFHPTIMPELVIMDPCMTTELPQELTAWTGMDALSHALEAYCVPSYHPMSDGLSVQALRLIANSLSKACHDGSDMNARSDMLAASGMACIALQKGLGGMHAISHALGARYDAHHGLLNAVLMPHVLEFNRQSIESKLCTLAVALNFGTQADAFTTWLINLRTELNIPDRLSEIGIFVDDIEDLSKLAANDICAAGNPVVLDEAAAGQIIAAAQ